MDSYAFGDEGKIDSNKLEFRDMMEEVERHKYTGKTLAWIRKLTKKKRRKSVLDSAQSLVIKVTTVGGA